MARPSHYSHHHMARPRNVPAAPSSARLRGKLAGTARSALPAVAIFLVSVSTVGGQRAPAIIAEGDSILLDLPQVSGRLLVRKGGVTDEVVTAGALNTLLNTQLDAVGEQDNTGP